MLAEAAVDRSILKVEERGVSGRHALLLAPLSDAGPDPDPAQSDNGLSLVLRPRRLHLYDHGITILHA
jgi:hypothetical protein